MARRITRAFITGRPSSEMATAPACFMDPIAASSSPALPLVIALELPLIAGFALALAALHAHFKDVRELLTSALTLLFFLTPVLYPIDAVAQPWLRVLVKILPATPFSLAYQQTLFFGVVPDAILWLEMAVVSLVGFAVGALVFSRLRETVVEAL